LANGAANSLTLSEGNFARLPRGRITVLGGNAGNTVDAGSLSAAHAVTVYAGSGLDAFTGGGGNDVFVFAPSNLAGDAVDGGSGSNTIELQAGGTAILTGLGTSFVNISTVAIDPGAAWTVGISNPAAFAGDTISGFARTDVIDLAGVTATSRTYAGGVLTVLNGAATVATMTIPGSFTTASFHLITDGNGGTDITVSTVASDFTGIGQSDILWHNASTGEVALYDSSPNSTSFTYQSLGTVPLSWSIQGEADFSGDGKDDILWRNTSTGEVALYDSSPNSGSFTYQSLGVVPTVWSIQAAADFTGNGQADILWRNTSTGEVALYDSSPNASSFTYQSLGVVPTVWSVQAAADFNGDGKADILWRNTSTGEVALYDRSKTSSTFTYQSLGNVPLNWSVQAAADFNGDGKADILFRNTTTGEVAEYDSSPNSNLFAYQSLGIVPLTMAILKVGDFNGDGRADILWRNTSTNGVSVWDSNGATGTFTQHDLGVISPNWIAS
jgi:hypothetical protein